MQDGRDQRTLGCLLALLVSHTVIAGEPQRNTSAAAASTPAQVLTPSLLEKSVASIGEITIDSRNVFDLETPEESGTLYKWANRVHATTRSGVIEEQLLFRPGDRFSAQLLEESERLIRGNRYIQAISINPVNSENGVVDVNVTTSDSWTLVPKLALSRSGGVNKGGLGIKELNLFGTGVAVEAQYKSDVDRTSSSIKYLDRNLGHSRYGLETRLADNSDGHQIFLRLGKPFYALDARDTRQFEYLDDERIESFYDRGERVAEYGHKTKQLGFKVGWSQGLNDGWTKRLTTGIAYDDNKFSEFAASDYAVDLIPESRKLVYPFVGIELLEDKYEKTSNIDQVNRAEDRFLGTRLSARLGLASSSLGSDRNAWILDASAQTAFGSSERDSLLLTAGISGRIESGVTRNFSLDVGAKYYRRQSDHRLLFASLSGTFGDDLDWDQTLELGGDSGLRGYPLRYQSGDKRVLLTIEQRYFTDWYPFRLFHVGGAVFFDAGRAWGEGPAVERSNDWLRDVGFGLRIGNDRSGLGRVTHIDVAFPLDGDSDIADLQFLVSTRKSF
jgi:outer membrane protein assembly factor BamA